MKLEKRGWWKGCRTYVIRDSEDVYVGLLYRERRTQKTIFGSERYQVWVVDLSPSYYRWDDLEWDYLSEAKQWLEENLE